MMKNPRQLVLRLDTATGLRQVGWESDLPIGRFRHIELICELDSNRLPQEGDTKFVDYQAACQRARDANRLFIEAQAEHHKAQGWFHVPPELSTTPLTADDFGCYANAAMSLMYQLTQNCKQVWSMVHEGRIIHVRSRQPSKKLDQLAYQVWYHQQLYQLDSLEGQVLEGSLMVCESGLWFIPSRPSSNKD